MRNITRREVVQNAVISPTACDNCPHQTENNAYILNPFSIENINTILRMKDSIKQQRRQREQIVSEPWRLSHHGPIQQPPPTNCRGTQKGDGKPWWHTKTQKTGSGHHELPGRFFEVEREDSFFLIDESIFSSDSEHANGDIGRRSFCKGANQK